MAENARVGHHPALVAGVASATPTGGPGGERADLLSANGRKVVSVGGALAVVIFFQLSGADGSPPRGGSPGGQVIPAAEGDDDQRDADGSPGVAVLMRITFLAMAMIAAGMMISTWNSLRLR